MMIIQNFVFKNNYNKYFTVYTGRISQNRIDPHDRRD